jgi:SAM-dependent methyltransferase
MSLADYLPTERFSGLADLYSQYRPTYPAQALDYIISRCGLGEGSVLVDVGCGTGISSRLFAARGLQIIGIEPNADMRRQAQKEFLNAQFLPPLYRDGRAEATGLPDASAHAVLAAQAFHWFEPQAALQEFHRILKPDGWVILLWNERDETDAFTHAYGDKARAFCQPEPCRGDGAPLLTSPLFQDGEKAIFPNEQVLDEEGLLGRAFSVSYAPRDDSIARRYADELRDLFRQFQAEGRVIMRYETLVFLARRRALVSPTATE